MTRRLISLLVMAVVLAVAAYCAFRMFAPPPDDLDLSRTKQSAASLYTVSIEPETEPVPRNDIHAWIATIETADGGPVTDAEIAIDGGMPAHGHGLPTEPRSAGHIGDGRYRIEGMRFNMAGLWVLRLSIVAQPGSDTVEFNLMM